MLKEQLMEVLATLTPREQKVIMLRYGIEDGHTRTLEDVGKAGLYLASDLSTGTTGQILYVDCGCHAVYASLEEMEIIANSIPKA